MKKFFALLSVFAIFSFIQTSSIGGERVKEFEFNPRIHSDNPTEEASFFVHPESKKLSICNAFNLQLTEPKPKKAICNVHCEILTTVKCTMPEIDIPECNEYAAYVYGRLLKDFSILEKQMDFSCEVPSQKDYKQKPKIAVPISQEIKTSPLCGMYRKETLASNFEFPCYVKCDTYIVGVSLDKKTADWELSCNLYQNACNLPTLKESMNLGSICDAYRQYVLSKVKLGEVGYHHCDVYNHGPQFDYFNRTIKH
ncbi:hypothetical protein PVAND_015885 [Polypedilum vanderplanki]|uniref:Uncharacterized protein n=1 Tax=Polypedilum vanderplanki TaxID=319348 RepID=A0A9J6BE89_POLVA|nr:hypothetical protein PVAND_015885 [Polypedilum vanderplanki]